MKKLSVLFLSLFLFSCSQNNKKNLLTYGTGAGTGMAGYSLAKSFLGQSGSGGNINQVIAITTLSTLMGVFMGSEIADNLYEEEQEVLNVSLNRNKKTTWSMVDEENNKEIITKIEPTEELTSNFGKQQCKKFNFSMEEGGYIKRGEGYACLNPQSGNWEMLGVEML
tara:strand:- start:196 stop:696 length:501 start_codon:yes stop_codon:yes gene_type:complete